MVGNVLVNNGTNATGPIFFLAADLTLLSPTVRGNCFQDNVYSTFWPGGLPPTCD